MTDSSSPDPSAPSDNTTLSSVLAGYEQDGFTDQFVIEDDGGLRCTTCGCTHDPHRVDAFSLRRLEGASDPADMSAVLALRCPSCGAKGTAVVMYGPESSIGDAVVLEAVNDRRDTDADVPGASPSSEAGDGRDVAP